MAMEVTHEEPVDVATLFSADRDVSMAEPQPSGTDTTAAAGGAASPTSRMTLDVGCDGAAKAVAQAAAASTEQDHTEKLESLIQELQAEAAGTSSRAQRVSTMVQGPVDLMELPAWGRPSSNSGSFDLLSGPW